MQEPGKFDFSAEQDRDPNKFRKLAESLLRELQEFANGDVAARACLLESEKEKIKQLINALNITIANFETTKPGAPGISPELQDYITQLKRALDEATQGFGNMEVKNMDGESVENDIPEVDPDFVEAKVEDIPEPSEKDKFDEWKDQFVQISRNLRIRLRAASPSDDFTQLRTDFDDLEDFYDTAVDNLNWRDFRGDLNLRKDQLERLRNLLEKLEKKAESPTNADEVDYSEFNPNHRQELVELFNLVSENEAFLSDVSWDPRVAIGGNIIDILVNQLAQANRIREAIVRDLGGVEGVDVDNDIRRVYIIPADEFLLKLEERVKLVDDEIFQSWANELRDAIKFPKIKLLGDEAQKVLPVWPYISPNTPEELIEVLKGNGPSNRGLIKEAQEEIDTKGYLPGDLGERQKQHFEREYLLLARKKLDALEELQHKVEKEEELVDWVTNIESFQEIIDIILALPANAEETETGTYLFGLETRLQIIYEELLENGFLDIESQSEDARQQILNLVGRDQKSGKYARVLKKITEIAARVRTEAEHPRNLSWPDLIKEIESTGLDVYNHGPYMDPSAIGHKVDIYRAFHGRKVALDRDSFPDTPEGYADYMEKEQERIDSVAWIVLSKIETINQNEGQVPTCTRPDLFPMLIKRHMERDTILKAVTYHPVHGELMRRMLDTTIKEVADDSSRISYNTITSSGDGRGQIRRFMRSNFEAEVNSLFNGLSDEEKKEKVDRVFDLAEVTYNLFDLLTVSFAELQKNTRTEAHQKTKGGSYLEKKNYVQITRPDAALVHSTQRYDSPSHVSALFELYMKEIPNDFGRRTAGNTQEEIARFHQMLVKQQEEIIMFQSCFYDVSKISGENGIKPTSLWDPLYPDTRLFLHLASNYRGATEMLVFGDDVYGLDGPQIIDANGIPRESYMRLGQKDDVKRFVNGTRKKLDSSFAITSWYEEVGMGGWEKILSLTFGTLPENITEHMILKSSNTGGEDPSLGLVDIMINSGCGMAKMFPGRHMDAVEQLFTHYLMRIFSRYSAGDNWRETTFRSVVSKIQTAAAKGGGLSGHRHVAAQIIRNISENIPSSWTDDDVLDVNTKKLGISKVLEDGLFRRRKQRIEWIIKYYQSENRGIPPGVRIPIIGESLTNITHFLDRFSFIDQNYFWRMVNGELPLPTDQINRNASLFKSVDEKH